MQRPPVLSISWNVWGTRGEVTWQYCESVKYAGNGILMNECGSKEYFWLPQRPNEEAFLEMENFKKNPRVIPSGRSTKRCDICGDGFRGEEFQNYCVRCLIDRAKSAEISAFQAQKKREELANEKKSLKRKLCELEDKLKNVEQRCNHSEYLHKVAKEQFEQELERLKKTHDALRLQNGGLTVRTHQMAESSEQNAKLLEQLTDVSENLADNYEKLQQIESANRWGKEAITKLEDSISSLRKDFSQKNNFNICSLLQQQVVIDLSLVFRKLFGKIRPNRNVRFNPLEKDIRSWPPCMKGLIQAHTEITLGKLLPFEDFIAEVKVINETAATEMQDLYNFGTIANAEMEERSVGHMTYDEMVVMMGFLPQSEQVNDTHLYRWNAISRKHANCKVLEHLKSVNCKDLKKYKYITAVKLELIDKVHCSSLRIEVHTKSLRHIDGIWEEDGEVTEKKTKSS
jgi:hypothetical protein